MAGAGLVSRQHRPVWVSPGGRGRWADRSFPAAGAAHENCAGTYLPLTVLFAVVLLVLCLLILALAYIHAMFSGLR